MKIDHKPRFNLRLVGLPDWLKDSNSYHVIRKKMYEMMSCRKGHSELEKMGNCFECAGKARDRKHFLKGLGFKSYAQYYEWRKVHELMIAYQTDQEKFKKYKIENYMSEEKKDDVV